MNIEPTDWASMDDFNVTATGCVRGLRVCTDNDQEKQIKVLIYPYLLIVYRVALEVSIKSTVIIFTFPYPIFLIPKLLTPFMKIS